MCIRDRYQRRVRGEQRPAMVLSLHVLALVVAVVSGHGAQEEDDHGGDPVVSLDDWSAGATSLVELSQEAVAGETEAMDERAMAQTKKLIVQLASNFQGKHLVRESIETTRLVKKVLSSTDVQLGEGHGSPEGGGSGLDLIFKKLNELERKIQDEQKQDDDDEFQGNQDCRAVFQNNDNVIEQTSDTLESNLREIQEASAKITSNRIEWRQSQTLETRNYQSLAALRKRRAEQSEDIRPRVDERNKAIDVMVKATFMVCERFNRYKNTPQCLEIKSQPDVAEPERYDTEEYAKAKHLTEVLHKSDKWKQDWDREMELDYDKHGVPNPEADGNGISGHIQDAAPLSLIELQEHHEQATLTADEQLAVADLATLAGDKELSDKYATPLNQLVMSLRSGAARRAKSIVEILLQVLKETRDEQANDKSQHTRDLHSFYQQIWELKELMNREAETQARLRREMEDLRLRILELVQQNEQGRVDQGSAHAAKTSEEDRCALTSEEYGVRTTIRREDLENLVKLKSLLRALYWKSFPKACPMHNRVLCTAKAQGWCVFTKRERGNTDQRCSCEPGFYGDACQFRMCPGLGKSTYQVDAPGVCSNRGACNRITGKCLCRDGYYHGPKMACDFKHAPESKPPDDTQEARVDDQCSEAGSVDRTRGRCNCKQEYFGPGCQERKCPNSNGVLYPRASGSACNGRGACDIQDGSCSCIFPYSGEACEFEACPNDCLGRGSCDQNTGHCACGNDEHGRPYVGPSCEYYSCPYDCTGGGECNRLDGTCICKDGFSGIQCEKTTRCPKATLHNDNMNWWTIWDKPGWMVCPKGQLMFQLKRSLCEALSCVDSGGCAAPCEGTTANNNHVFQTRHCYHDLRWYNSFDTAGTSECLTDYFVAGLFRSCESLYCLNMAKCCSLKEARWTKCTWTNWAIFNGPGTGKVGRDQFIVGFKRGEGHQLKNLDEAKGCEFVRGY
eukprot:TRINITY_DN680_c0_g3_i2.p1 TRINITY_DN680_c0_g3~~TRINITY_DN680_c0_g3_i2.p1  ORF type:complete len:971 (+),score=254.93 TRINITY_DN680_c0_g3_i2:31-2913(+)